MKLAEEMNDKDTLISIIVITYNSAQFVLETLESIKYQDYNNIELIITDDCSKDNTVELCKNWASENKERFTCLQILTVEKNTGIPSNCNRGLKAANGLWIKYIAGDDALKTNCITTNYNYVIENKTIEILQTKSDVYNDVLINEQFIGTLPAVKSHHFFDASFKEQYRMLFRRNYVAAPSMFLNRKVVLNVGGFDEDFKSFEDITMWLNLTKVGHKIYFLNVATVNYRIHIDSVSKQSKPNMAASFAEELLRFRRKYSAKESTILFRIKYTLRLKLIIYLDKMGFNNKSVLSKYLYKLVNLLNK